MNIQGLLNTTAENFVITQFFLNIFLSVVFSYVLAFLFQRYSLSFSDRRRLASTFVLLCVATMCVITVVKTSLALSLGLVGALSIVRFRTPIKEPEELVFLFLNIVIGIAFGANQVIVGTAVFLTSSVLILLRYWMLGHLSLRRKFAHLIIGLKAGSSGGLESVQKEISQFSEYSAMRRIDANDDYSEIVMDVAFNTDQELEKTLVALRELGCSVTYVAAGSD